MNPLRKLKKGMLFLGAARSPLGVPALALAAYAINCQLEGGRWLDSFLRKHWRVVPLRPRGCDGAEIWVDLTDFGHLLSFYELILHHSYDFRQVPFEPANVIDCGAHIGIFTVLASRRYPKATLAAFEPNPNNAQFARRQIQTNGVKAEFIEAAVGSSDCVADFTVPTRFSNGGHLGEGLPGTSCRVKVVNFVEFVRGLGPAPLLLKMDIEGEEANLLPALIPYLPRQCAIFFETHSGPTEWNSLTEAMAVAGFSVTATRRRWPYCDGFALRTTG